MVKPLRIEQKLLDRRSVLGMLGLAAVAAACGTGKPRIASPSDANSSEYKPVAGGSPGTVGLSGPAQPANKQFTSAQLTRFRDRYAGHWAGSWAEEGGRQGTADVSAAIDVARRVGTYTLAFTGPLLGGPPPPATTYVVSLNQFDASAQTGSAQTRQLGKIDVTVLGFGKVNVRATSIPGHDDIDAIDIVASADTPVSGTTTYMIHRKSGVTERGALAFAKGPVRPPVPSPGQANAQNDFITGAYAAGLVTGAELTQALGEPIPAPGPNGGKLNYAPGINVSNATSTTASGDIAVQYGIYKGADAPSIATHWHLFDAEPVIATIGDAARAHVITGQPYFELYVLKGTEVLRLQLVLINTTKPTDQVNAMYVAVARAIAARMGP